MKKWEVESAKLGTAEYNKGVRERMKLYRERKASSKGQFPSHALGFKIQSE